MPIIILKDISYGSVKTTHCYNWSNWVSWGPHLPPLLERGGFRVRGTVRDKDNAAKIDPLRASFGDLFG
jgi:hypothetical protein